MSCCKDASDFPNSKDQQIYRNCRCLIPLWKFSMCLYCLHCFFLCQDLGLQIQCLILYKDNFSTPLVYTLSQVIILQAQADIISKEIHSVDLDPSCPYQLAFHLDDGWQVWKEMQWCSFFFLSFFLFVFHVSTDSSCFFVGININTSPFEISLLIHMLCDVIVLDKPIVNMVFLQNLS